MASELRLAGTGYQNVGALNNLTGSNTVSGTITNIGATTINASTGTLTLSGTVSTNFGLTI